MFASWTQLVPRLRKFNKDLKILNTVLTDLIARAKSSENKADLEDLQARNYDKVSGGGGGEGLTLTTSTTHGAAVVLIGGTQSSRWF